MFHGNGLLLFYDEMYRFLLQWTFNSVRNKINHAGEKKKMHLLDDVLLFYDCHQALCDIVFHMAILPVGVPLKLIS